MASSRSSASSSSSKSASRVTRNGWCASTSMPGNRASSFAAMTCSRSTKCSPSGERDEAGEQRRDLHAREPVVAARGIAHGDGQVQGQVGDVREGVRGVDRQRREDREDRGRRTSPRGGPGRRRPGRPSRRSGSLRPRATGTISLANTAADRSTSSSTRPRIVRSWSTRSSPSAVVVRRPAASCSMRPETRTSKNSSRFWLKMARNLARSSSGRRSSSARARTRALNSSHESSRLRKRSEAVAERRSPVRDLRGCGVQPGHRPMLLPNSRVPNRADRDAFAARVPGIVRGGT